MGMGMCITHTLTPLPNPPAGWAPPSCAESRTGCCWRRSASSSCRPRSTRSRGAYSRVSIHGRPSVTQHTHAPTHVYTRADVQYSVHILTYICRVLGFLWLRAMEKVWDPAMDHFGHPVMEALVRLFCFRVRLSMHPSIHPLASYTTLPHQPNLPHLNPHRHQVEPFVLEPLGLFKRRTKRVLRRTRKAALLAGAAIALGFSTGGLRGGFSVVARAAASVRSPAPAPVGGTSTSLAAAAGPGLVMERPAVAVRPGAVAGIMGRGGQQKEAGAAAVAEKTVRCVFFG